MIPYRIGHKERKYLLNAINIKDLFLAQCKDGKIHNTKLSVCIVRFLSKIEEYSLDYSEVLLATLKEQKDCTPEQKRVYMGYIGESKLYRRQTEAGKCLCEYILYEFSNERRVLSIADLSDLLTITCDDEEDYIDIYNLFMQSDSAKQNRIIRSVVEYCGSNIFIFTPKIQRMFLDMCEIVYSWGDDKLTAELLLYCLFIRTYDIFTVDEIFRKVLDFNDDVFYSFFWGVAYGEFGMGTDEYYNLDDDERLRITDIIKSRNHPREEKLLEHLYR